jgi:hypothetical protein
MENTQPLFANPPRAITTKDLLYLKDALSWELLAMKKFHFLSQQAENDEIKKALDNAGRMHQNHYQKLLLHLQVDNTEILGKIQNQDKSSSK